MTEYHKIQTLFKRDMESKEKTLIGGAFEAEGIVARPKTELCTRAGHRMITKIKCRDFARGTP